MSIAPQQKGYAEESQGTPQNPFVYYLMVSGKEDNEQVEVTPTPAHWTLNKGEWIHFKSNHATTAIRFLQTSPFFNPVTQDGEPRPWQVFELGPDGKLVQVQEPTETAKFECGYVNRFGDFEVWAGKGGLVPGGNGGN